MDQQTPDRNKSELTHKITDATWQWLDLRGFKPTETEVGMPWTTNPDSAKGWVADLASVIYPTQTELINMGFMPRRPPWKAPQEKRDAWEQAFRLWERRLTCLVEVKASRSDYVGDRKWKLIPPTDLAFVAVPSKMVKPEEWPEGWGVIELRGDTMVKVRNPTPRVATMEEHLFVIYNIAERRDHRTRYEQHRESQKRQRIQAAASTSVSRWQDIVRVVTDLKRGTIWGKHPVSSVQQVCRWHGIHEIKDSLLEELAAAFEVPAREPETEIQSGAVLSNADRISMKEGA